MISSLIRRLIIASALFVLFGVFASLGLEKISSISLTNGWTVHLPYSFVDIGFAFCWIIVATTLIQKREKKILAILGGLLSGIALGLGHHYLISALYNDSTAIIQQSTFILAMIIAISHSYDLKKGSANIIKTGALIIEPLIAIGFVSSIFLSAQTVTSVITLGISVCAAAALPWIIPVLKLLKEK